MKMAMEMAPGALPRPGRVPEQRLSVPRISLLVAAALRRFFWKYDGLFRVFSPGLLIGEGGKVGGGPGTHTPYRRHQGLAAPGGGCGHPGTLLRLCFVVPC